MIAGRKKKIPPQRLDLATKEKKKPAGDRYLMPGDQWHVRHRQGGAQRGHRGAIEGPQRGVGECDSG